jgi:hypothetical protein
VKGNVIIGNVTRNGARRQTQRCLLADRTVAHFAMNARPLLLLIRWLRLPDKIDRSERVRDIF